MLFWNDGVFEFVYENFEMVEREDREYILDSIISYMNKKGWKYMRGEELGWNGVI